MQVEGQTDQATGKVKQAGEKVKDVFKSWAPPIAPALRTVERRGALGASIAERSFRCGSLSGRDVGRVVVKPVVHIWTRHFV
jgi:hypothetical protein